MADSGTSKLPAPFGKYLLTQLIAVGGMAEVYRAKIFGASGFEKDMVVKRILPRYASNPNFVQMLIDEAKIAVSLSHGNIVPIYELGEYEGSYYIAMEYVEGRTVLDILRDSHSKKRPLPWAYCLGIAADVAKGLAYAHARTDVEGNPLGLVHRDINPRNIVVTPAGEVKILDFGIARASTKRHQTASGVIKGTPGYMSPEQMYGHTVDSRSDIYCLGILVYELLTLRRLFPVWDVTEMRAVFEAGPIPMPSSLARHVAPEADAVIMKALTQDIGARFQSAGDFEEALRTVIARSGTAVTASGLAREVTAIDDAPGPRAPRTAPPVVESRSGGQVRPSPTTVSEKSRRSPSREEEAAKRPAAASNGASPRPSAPEAAARTPPPAPRPTSAAGARSAAQAAGAAEARGAGAPKAADPVKTQQMAMPQAPAAGLDAAHSFVISLVDAKADARPAAPLPSVSADEVTRGTRTQILAQNAAVDWAQEIGDDAEMLALLKATGAHPSSGLRTLLAAAAVALVGLGLVYAFFGAEITGTIKRAVSGQKAELGVIVVKTIPSGAEVTLDGKSKGKTNLKVQGVDVNEAHRLVVKPKERDAFVIELERKDFEEGEDGRPTYVFERDLTPK
jgi:serine/threonine protein kinase